MLNPLLTASRAATKAPPQEDRRGLLRQIAGKVLSPLAAVGNVLDLPGSSVRDVLTGNNPFDQYLTPFRDDNRSTGREVNTRLFGTAPNDPHRWEWADAGGFLTEMATDPLTLVSGIGGGLGKALQGTGKSSHLFKVGLPFTKGALPVGKTAAGLIDNVAAKGWASKIPFVGGKTFGEAGDAVNLARNGLFDFPSGGAFDKLGQTINKRRTALADDLGPAAYEASAKLKGEMLPVQEAFMGHNSHLAPEVAQDAWDRVLTHSQELAGRAGNHKGAFDQAYQEIVGSPAPAGLSSQAEAPLKSWAGGYRKVIDEERDWGARINKYDHEHTAYTARQANKDLLKSQDKSAGGGGLYSHEGSAHREDILANVPQEYLRKMLKDDSLGGKSKYIGNNPIGGGAQIEKDFGKHLGYGEIDPTTGMPSVTPKEHAQQLAEYLGSLDPSIKSIHEIAPAGLLERRHASSARIVANMQATHETFADAIADAIKAGSTSKTVSLKDAFSTVGMDGERAVQKYASMHSMSADDAAKLRVGSDVVDRITALNKWVDNPPWLDFIGKQMDRFNETFKSNVTMPFPSFHIRNWLSGQHLNVSSGHINNPADLGRYMKAYRKAMAIRSTGASDPLIREAMAHKLLGSKIAFEDVTLRGTSDIGPGLMDSIPKGYRDAKDFVADPANASVMDAIPCGKAVRTGYNTLMNTGSNVAQTAEYYNRMPMYLYLREQGMSPAKAAKEVEKLQFDYSKITPFERSVAKRAIPFYCVPDHSEALTRDGWVRYEQLEFGDEILTYSLERDVYEWQPCLEVAAFPCDQEIMVWESERHRLEFTDNHRWPVQYATTVDKVACKKVKVVTGDELNANHQFIIGARLDGEANQDSLLTPDQASLLGWLVTDGHWRHRGNCTEGVIYQHPNKFIAEVAEVAGGKARTPHPDTGVVCVPVLKERLYEIRKHLDKDKLIEVVTRLSVPAMEAMYDAMYMADGTTSANRTQDFFAAEHPGVRKAFRVLATLLGKSASESNRGSYVSHRRFMKVAEGELKREHYKGVVWCPRTENTTWVMRQNNKIVVTGNTFNRKITPQIASMLIDRPGGPIAQTIRASNAGRDPEDVQMPHIASTAAIPLNPLEDGTKRYLTGFGLAPEAAMPYLGGASDPQGALLNAGASLTPLLKYPMEKMAGQVFFQRGADGGGRKLNDLDPSVGRLLTNMRQAVGSDVEDPTMWMGGNRDATMAAEHLLGNLPTTKYTNVARTLTDKRKWNWGEGIAGGVPDALMNVATPLNTTMVSPQQQERLIQNASNSLADSLGAGSWSNRYFSEKNMAKLERDNPLAAAQARALKAMWSEAKRNAKKVKAGDKTKKTRTKSEPGMAQTNELLRAAGL